ncbi:MAG TPA: carbohydrate-binding protein [Candidatus Limiplasma sp.]|nr:carbohydrate-binding protein [Candidatus Limiplasma sp.]
MNRIRIKRQEEILAACDAEGEALLCFHGAYQPGDTIELESSSQHVIARLDHTMLPARVYLPDQKWIYALPLEGDLPDGQPPFAFQGDCHAISLREDAGNEYRNIACNPADQRHDSHAYPHASANVETRDESVFFARNTIDGMHTAAGHGEWPYLSWGIGGRADAAIRLDFGRKVVTDTMVLYIRADFVHDGYWVKGTLHLSDGYEKTFDLQKLDGPQAIPLDGPHTVTWAQLDHLITTDAQPSPFPSLRQWEFFGRDAEMQ